MIHGVELRSDRDRIALFVEQGKGPYEPETVANFQEAIAADPEGCVIDVGAYSGLFTILALRAGAEEVIALEPNQQGYERLRQNVEPYDGYPYGVLRTVNAAASSEAGTGSLEVTGEHVAICTTGKLRPASDGPAVEVVKIDDLERERRVSVMKIDVEGHEIEALKGAALTLETDHPVLFVEVNSRSGGDRTAEVRDFLAPFGYQGEQSDERNMVFRAR